MLAGMEPNEAKQILRRNAIRRRKTTNASDRRQAGEALACGIDALPLPAPHRTVAAYLSMGSEIETRPMLRALAERRYRLLLPRLGRGLDVGWGEYSGTAVEDHGTHRPQEPTGDTLPASALAHADLVLLPALLVDAHGVRLGRGSGWYDRALAHCVPGTPIVAVCWPWEVGHSALPHEPHDVPVTATYTPCGYSAIAYPQA